MASRFAIEEPKRENRFAIGNEPLADSGAVVVAEMLNQGARPEQFMDNETAKVWLDGQPTDADRSRFTDNAMIAQSAGVSMETADLMHDEAEKTGFLQEMKDQWTDPIQLAKKLPIAGGLVGVNEMIEVKTAAERLNNPEHDYTKPIAVISPIPFQTETGLMSGIKHPEIHHTKETDIEIVQKYIDRVTKDRTFGAKVAAGVSVLPTWFIEFAMTGGLAQIGKESTKKAAIKLLGNYTKSDIGKKALSAAGWVGGAITRTTVGLPTRVAEKGAERQVQVKLGMREQEGWATSFAKAWGDIVIESASEEAGETITKGLGAIASKTKLGAALTKGLQKAWIKATGGTASAFNKTLTKGGYSNMIGEIGEESLGTVLRAITDVEDFGAGSDATVMQRLKAGLEQDLENLPVTATVLAIPFAGQTVVAQLSGAKPVEVTLGPAIEAPVVAVEPSKPKVAEVTAKPAKPVTAKPSKTQATIDMKKFVKQVQEHEALVKGEQGIVDVEPIDFDIEKDQPEGLTPQWYENNREVYKKSVLSKAGQVAKDVGVGIEKVITPISTRLHNIQPKLFRRTRRHVFNVMTRTTEQTKKTETFISDVKKIPKIELKELDLAFKNSDGKKINEILKKHGLTKEFKNIRKVLDDLFDAGTAVGLNIDYRRNYMPRVIKDAKGFLDFVRGTDDWPVMEEAIKRQEKARNRALTEDERAVIANTMLRGYRTSALAISAPGATKARTVPVVDAKLNQFYMSFTDSLVSYIRVMNESIAAREFFGKETKVITKTRGQLSAARTRNAKLERKENESVEKFKERRQKSLDKITELENLLEALNASDLSDTIGAYVDQLIVDGEITHSQERQVTNMLQSMFNPSGMGNLLGAAKTLTYITHLGSPLNAITQIEDLAISFYRSPLGALPEAVRATLNKSEIVPQDIGINTIATEIDDAGMMKRALIQILRITGFEKIDRVGKQTFINTVLKKMRKQADKPTKNFKDRLKRVFGEDFQAVIEDLKAHRNSDNVKYLLFNQLLDVQPLALTEMPEAYNRSGNLRILYTLKTFMIRQFDFIRNEALSDMRKKDTFMRGFGRLVWLTSALALFGAGVDAIKDFIRGRDFDLQDSVVDNILRRFMFSKYQINTAKRDGILRSFLEGFLPPTALLDRMARDMVNVWEDPSKANQSLRSLPIVGELLYNWWFAEKKTSPVKLRDK